MKQDIIENLRYEKRALEAIEINNKLNLESVDEYQNLCSILDEMEKNGEIFKTNKGKFILFDNCY